MMIIIMQIAEVCRGWFTQISTAIEVQQRRKRIGNGPLAEIDYWRERNAAISALYEQLKVMTSHPHSLLVIYCMP